MRWDPPSRDSKYKMKMAVKPPHHLNEAWAAAARIKILRPASSFKIRGDEAANAASRPMLAANHRSTGGAMPRLELGRLNLNPTETKVIITASPAYSPAGVQGSGFS